MPKIVGEMSALAVKRLRHPGGKGNHVVAVGGVSGLLLQITESNSTSWILRTLVGGRRRQIGIGGYPDVTLAQAHERAREAKDAIRRALSR